MQLTGQLERRLRLQNGWTQSQPTGRYSQYEPYSDY